MEQSVKKAGLLHHPKLPESQDLAQEMAHHLEERGVAPWLCSAWDEDEVACRVGDLDLLITLGGSVLSLFITGSWITLISLLLGGLLMLLNFHFLWRFSRRVLEKPERNKGRYLAGLFFSFFLFLGAVAFVLLVLEVPMIPFFLGTLALILSILLNSLIFV